jgi:hypothetical protein
MAEGKRFHPVYLLWAQNKHILRTYANNPGKDLKKV